MTNEQVEWLSNASYEDMLRRNRFAPIGDTMFLGVAGQFFAKQMSSKKNSLTMGEIIAVSKHVGWEG